MRERTLAKRRIVFFLPSLCFFYNSITFGDFCWDNVYVFFLFLPKLFISQVATNGNKINYYYHVYHKQYSSMTLINKQCMLVGSVFHDASSGGESGWAKRVKEDTMGESFVFLSLSHVFLLFHFSLCLPFFYISLSPPSLSLSQLLCISLPHLSRFLQFFNISLSIPSLFLSPVLLHLSFSPISCHPSFFSFLPFKVASIWG